MCVLRPLKVVIENYPEGQSEEFDFANHPQKPELGTRKVTFSRELYIERDDFMADPPKKYNRLGPGREVRLRNSYVIRFQSMERDEKTGEVTQINCTYDPATRNAPPADGRKVQGVIHWVCAGRAVPAEVRLYDRLFTVEDPGSMDNFLDYLNQNSLEVLTGCYVEPGLKNVPPGTSLQFERLGYFCADEKDSKDGRLVFNRVVSLRDSWAKIAAKG